MEKLKNVLYVLLKAATHSGKMNMPELKELMEFMVTYKDGSDAAIAQAVFDKWVLRANTILAKQSQLFDKNDFKQVTQLVLRIKGEGCKMLFGKGSIISDCSEDGMENEALCDNEEDEESKSEGADKLK